MKVVQINAVYGFGSTGIIVRDIDQMLKQHGEDSCVVYQKSEVLCKDGFRVGNPIDWKWHALLTRVQGKQGYASIWSTQKMLNYLDIQKPDIVHLHNLHSNYINLNMLLSYLAKKNIPTVVTLHDCWFFTGKCFHFIACGCDKWKNRCGNCPQNKEDVKSLIFDQSRRVFEDKEKYFQEISNLTVVGCSDWIKNLAEKSPVFYGKNIIRIYNGVDTDIFYYRDKQLFRNKNKLNNQFVILGMANKWMQKKNRDIFKEVVNSLEEDESLIIIGCSENQQKELSGMNKVFAFGYIKDRNELADIYSSSNVFVNLTFEDTLPTVNMESICCGTPVITYASCGSPELVEEGRTGYVISTKNFTALRNSLSRIKAGTLSRAECEKVGQKRFDKNIQYLKYLKVYKDLIKR